MTNLTLVAETQMPPEQLASNAGRTCYESSLPAVDKAKIDVKERLFKTGHHTTLEHSYFTFAMDNVSVSTITYGFHLAHPFYNSDQRSGRFSKMYDNPDFDEIERRIEHYYPGAPTDKAMDLVKFGAEVYRENKESLTDVAADVLRKERPNATDKYVDQNAKKMAQEQLRAFISTAMETGMYHTVDLITLAALQRVAWMPEMREAVHQMSEIVVERHPEISYVFDFNKNGTDLHFCDNLVFGKVKHSPSLTVCNIDIPANFSPIIPEAGDSVDTLLFDPMSMDNNVYSIRTVVELSTMTMGQDQRHRTIGRGIPRITGDFYLSPLLRVAGGGRGGVERKAEEFQRKWTDLLYSQPRMANFVVPYGVMARYQKRSSVNALLHEQEKRLCWCAQEEIYNLNAQLANQLKAAGYEKLSDALRPHCAKGGCLEGARYCGRDMNVLDYFTQRQI